MLAKVLQKRHLGRRGMAYDLRKHSEVDSGLLKQQVQHMDFDSFTTRLLDTHFLKQLDTMCHQQSKYIVKEDETVSQIKFPWNFQETRDTPPMEKNLLCSHDYSAFLEQDAILELYSQFLTHLEKKEVDSLLGYVEKSFKKRLGKMHKDFEDNQYKIEVSLDPSFDRQVELYNIRNVFGVGVHIDRQKNDPSEKYRVFDTLVTSEGGEVPTRNVVKMRPGKNESACLIGQFDLAIYSNDQVVIRDGSDRVVCGSSGPAWHLITLETVLWEMNYRVFKRNKERDNNQLILKGTRRERQWMISEVELFMGGNDLLHR